jgi:hypothetical protein
MAMADDQTNPFVMAGMAAMMQPNKYTDPSLQGKPLQLQGYRGTPTDAMGRPIQSFLDAQSQHDAWDAANPAPAQGMTLNQTPNAATPIRGIGGLQPGQWDGANGLPTGTPDYSTNTGIGMATDPSGMPNGQTPLGRGVTGTSWQPQRMMPQPQQQQQAPQPQNPVDMRQAYLDALSNPGKVTTPGATVPQSQPLGSPSVMSSFLAAHPGGGGAGAGGYNNSGFFQTLNKLRAAQ